jgi:gluconokinase
MVIVVMGVSGSGKTTVGRALALAVGGEFRDADDYHTPESIAKMARGMPLSDEDRAPWLDVLRELIDEWCGGREILVLACSALSRRIRQRLGVERDGVRVVHLEGTRALLDARMRERKHFMPAELLESQLALLERPSGAVVLDAAQPIDTLIAEIRRSLSV